MQITPNIYHNLLVAKVAGNTKALARMSKILVVFCLVLIAVCLVNADGYGGGTNVNRPRPNPVRSTTCKDIKCPIGQRCSQFVPCRGKQPCPPGPPRCIVIRNGYGTGRANRRGSGY